VVNLGAIINTIIGALAGAMFGAWFTLKYVEERKRKDKRKILLGALLMQLNKYNNEKLNEHEIGSPALGFSQRAQTMWELLNSDLLDRKKDGKLIESLHEMIGWVENYNQLNNLANLAMIFNSDKTRFVSEGRDILNMKSRKAVEELKSIIKNKLKK
jgi:ATP-dependent protease HslVU (ClpYQ) peptidase subunit